MTENISKFKILSKGKRFKNLLSQDERKPKQIMLKQSHMIRIQIFEKVRFEGIKKGKTCRILCDLVSAKKSPRQLLTKENILKRQLWAKKWIKIDFFRVILIDES